MLGRTMHAVKARVVRGDVLCNCPGTRVSVDSCGQRDTRTAKIHSARYTTEDSVYLCHTVSSPGRFNYTSITLIVQRFGLLAH